MNQQERRLYLIRELLQETQEPSLTIPTDFLAQKQLLRGLMNIRPPRPISQSFLRIQDAYLQEEQRKKGIVTLDTLSPIQPGIYFMARRHYDLVVRCYRQRCQQRDDRMLCSQSSLH